MLNNLVFQSERSRAILDMPRYGYDILFPWLHKSDVLRDGADVFVCLTLDQIYVAGLVST